MVKTTNRDFVDSTVHGNVMAPTVFNKICARPVVVSWLIGAWIVNALILKSLSKGAQLASIVSDGQGMAFLLVAVAAASGLGFFLGCLRVGRGLGLFAAKFNGAPFQLEDRVMIIAGPLRGTVATVEDITKGQGGWNVIWLDLDAERRKKFSNIFEEYSLVKLAS